MSRSNLNAATVIGYQLPERSHVKLQLYDLMGREVKLLVDQEHEAGTYQARWDGRDGSGNPMPTGVYIYRIQVGGFTSSKRLLLVK